MKTLALIVRRPDHTRQAFRDHYEQIHAPLAMETVMEGTIRYVRHHVRDEIHGVPAFDVVTAFQYRDAAGAAALLKRLETEAGRRIQADEATFMDRDKNGFFAVEEVPVRGAEDRERGLCAIALVRAPAEQAREDFVRRYEAEDVPALLDATAEPVWCLQNRALAIGPPPAFDAVTQLHARADAGLGAWAKGLRERDADVVVIGVEECETETPWQ